MQSVRLNYAYRLSAARLTILRLRVARRWQRLAQSTPSSSNASALRGLATLAILGVILGSAWLGYRTGTQAEVDSTVLTESRSVTANRTRDGQIPDAMPAAKKPSILTPVAAAASVVPAASEPEGAESQAKAARLTELASLRNTVGELQAQVLALEQEASGLEVELMDQQLTFANAQEQWKEETVDRRIVYNITNIPVGGFVSEERIESDAEQAEFPASESDFNDQASINHDADPYGQFRDDEGPAERWNGDANLSDVPEQQFTDANANYEYQADGSTDQAGSGTEGRYLSEEPSSPSGLPNDNEEFQELFFGPGADRFEDWNNP